MIADGGVRRDATLGLAAVRLLRAGRDEPKTLVLRRYILGLSLVTFTSKPESYLRQGCTLVFAPDQPREFVEVYPDGKRSPCEIADKTALAYATEAAKAFGVGESRSVVFEKERAKRDVKADGNKKAKTKRGKKSDAAVAETEAD